MSSGKICCSSTVFLQQTGTREGKESRGHREKWREDGEEGEDRRYVGGERLGVQVAHRCEIPISDNHFITQSCKRNINNKHWSK